MNELEELLNSDMNLQERENALSDYNDYAKVQAEASKPKEKTLRQKIVMDIENKVIVLSASFIKEFLYKGDKTDHCPRKIYQKYIGKQWVFPSTENQLKGLFFESLCIGASADGTATLDLPRKPLKKGQKIGDKTVDQERLEEQALVFNQTYPQHGVIIMKSGEYKNVQKEFCIEWKDPRYQTYNDWKIYIQGTTDIISPITFGGKNYPMAIIDLKSTKNRKSTFGKWAWGNVGKEGDQMDHIQAYLYHFCLDLPFFYWVWDYPSKAKDRGNEIIPVRPFEDNPESHTKVRELHESIRKTIEMVILYHTDAWPENGDFHSVCEDCPGNTKNGGQCKFCNTVREV